MLYTEVTFKFTFQEEYLQDMFYQGLADLGFESFMDEKAYIQTSLMDEAAVRRFAQENGQEVVSIEACPDDNWNATWEAEHPMQELPDGVKIIPHCAFGAGHHETTGMMIETLSHLYDSSSSVRAKEVLDMGCGTGVLGIYAAKYGATHVVAVDIDDKSVTNTIENAALNDVEIDVRLGSNVPEGTYDLIMANIHRNILLDMMSDFALHLKSGGKLLMSGFYENDIPLLVTSAKEQGFHLDEKHERGEWRMIVMTHE